MNLDKLLAVLTPDAVRATLPGYLAGFVDGEPARAATQRRIVTVLDAWSDEGIAAMLHHLREVGRAHVVYDADPLCRQLSRAWCAAGIPEVDVSGAEHLATALASGPTVVLCNHLSYLDTTATDAALERAGHGATAERLVVLAGPKVYADLMRRVAASALHTLPVPQSTQLDHTARVAAKELAARVHESVDAAEGALSVGRAVLIYPEGSRSRTGRLQPFLRGVGRYLRVDGLRVVPAAIVGTDALYPVDVDLISPGPVALRLGESFSVASVGDPRTAVGEAFDRIASLLPSSHHPEPGEPALR